MKMIRIKYNYCHECVILIDKSVFHQITDVKNEGKELYNQLINLELYTLEIEIKIFNFN